MRYLSKAVIPAVLGVCLAWSAAAVPITYHASLSGPAEAPPNASPGTGSAVVVIDTDAHTMNVSFVFADLLAGTTVAHIHGPTVAPFAGTASVMTTTPSFPGFPSGVTSGSYDQSFDLTDPASFNPSFITAQGSVAAAEAALAAALAEGRAYLNIHSELFPAGEIRGFLAVIPLPASLAMLLGALVAFGWVGRRPRLA